MKRIPSLFLVVLPLFLAACGDAAAPEAGGEPEPRPSRRAPGVSAGPARGGELDGLTLTLELDRTVLAPGEETGSQLVVENETDAVITDPGCVLGAPSYGILPSDDPEGELEHSVIVDCGGPHDYQPGDHEEFGGHSFRAATIQGDPLPPGDYVAAMEFRGVSERLLVPVTIVED